jgi:60 kDa SS-A/Ro ribonucleoprotein
MAKNYASAVAQQKAPQRVKDRSDQVQNNAGGYVYDISDIERLDRFLILGSDTGTYYVGSQKMTRDNAEVVDRLINAGRGREVLDRVFEISDQGRAPKNDAAIFAAAMVLASDDVEAKQYLRDNLNKVVRIGTHLFALADFVYTLRGNRRNRSIRNALSEFYSNKSPHALAKQVVKYASRRVEGSQAWSHTDIVSLVHPKPATPGHESIFRYLTIKDNSKGNFRSNYLDELVNADLSSDDPMYYIQGHEKAKRASTADEVVAIVKKYGLTRESVPTQFLNDSNVWESLLNEGKGMPLTATIRNLGKMTSIGLIGPMEDANQTVAAKLRDKKALQEARIHPINVLAALRTYSSGSGARGNLSWSPQPGIVDALDDAFYESFKTVEPTGKRIMVAVDCSGSMGCGVNGIPGLTARDVAAAVSLMITKTEKNSMITGFSSAGGGYWNRGQSLDGIDELPISSRMRLDTVINKMAHFPWGGTDCALPMLYAKAKKLKFDAFVVITDNETWAGSVKPDQALRDYRKASGITDAKLAVLGTSATSFSIADPKDRNMLDFVGFDSAAPQLLSEFLRGSI